MYFKFHSVLLTLMVWSSSQ